MIAYTILCKSNHWPKRIKKIDKIIKKVLVYKKELKFINNNNYYCNFVLANDKFIKKLNYKYKKKNKSTDVLSFPSFSSKKLKSSKEKNIYIGDIAISYEIINSRSKNNNFILEFEKVWVHGFLHLIGYNHIKNKDYFKMRRLEKKILNMIF